MEASDPQYTAMTAHGQTYRLEVIRYTYADAAGAAQVEEVRVYIDGTPVTACMRIVSR